MTEPGRRAATSGHPHLRPSATANEYVLNGPKTFISSGIMADIVVVAARTDAEAGPAGLSLLVVERDTPGFERGRKLDKVGLHAQDTAELFFRDGMVPAANLLGEEGRGLHYLMSNLPRERLGVAAKAIANSRAIFDHTVEYCRQRMAFGKPLTGQQHIRFELAEMEHPDRHRRGLFVDRCVLAFNAGELSRGRRGEGANGGSPSCRSRSIDRCLQLHGGYGYMLEYPIARAYSRLPGPDDLRRDHRDHEGDHRPLSRARLTRLRRIRCQSPRRDGAAPARATVAS